MKEQLHIFPTWYLFTVTFCDILSMSCMNTFGWEKLLRMFDVLDLLVPNLCSPHVSSSNCFYNCSNKYEINGNFFCVKRKSYPSKISWQKDPSLRCLLYLKVTSSFAVNYLSCTQLFASRRWLRRLPGKWVNCSIEIQVQQSGESK